MDSFIDSFKIMINHLFLIYGKMYSAVFQVPIEIELTDNLDLRHNEIRPDLTELLSLKSVHSDDNGRLVIPQKVGDTFYILLNETKIREYILNKDPTWIGTITHEITHAIDFYQMAQKRKLDNYSELEKAKSLFASWSEYHAKRVGYSFLRSICVEMNLLQENEETCEYIINEEWPYFKEKYYKAYNENSNDGIYQIYLTMHILGRYSVWNDLYPNKFNVENLLEDFYNAPWIGNLYIFLRKYEDVESIYPCFNLFCALLASNWKWIQ